MAAVGISPDKADAVRLSHLNSRHIAVTDVLAEL